VADRWIISRLQQTEAKVADALEGYRFDHAAQAIYEFTWNEYCDWYLELSKPILNDDAASEAADAQGSASAAGDRMSEAAKRGTRRTLVRVLETLLRLAHPIMPFITEEIWQRVAPLAGASGATIMNQTFPLADKSSIDNNAITEMEWVKQFILGIRKIKGEMNIAPGKPVPVLLSQASDSDKSWAEKHRAYLDFLARTESIEVLPEGDEGPESATALVGEMKLLIPLSGLIDRDAELARLEKELGKLKAEAERVEKKLSNPNFVDKAPDAVVQKERDKLSEAKSALAKLEEQAERIKSL
jgi:valyl-tRNA synthetase